MGWPRSVITLTAERVGSAGTVPDFLGKSANRPPIGPITVPRAAFLDGATPHAVPPDAMSSDTVPATAT